ncbi:MAG: hypothetical protein AB7S92_14785 [Parvibaculaceae bacterium]
MKHTPDRLSQQKPEDVLLAWLMHLPPDADVATAAACEIARLDRKEGRSAGIARLRELLLDVIDASRH